MRYYSREVFRSKLGPWVVGGMGGRKGLRCGAALPGKSITQFCSLHSVAPSIGKAGDFSVWGFHILLLLL